MDPFWEGFILGSVTSTSVLIVYLILAIAAMTMYKVWFKR